MNSQEAGQIEEIAVTWARQAGEITLGYFRGEYDVDIKKDGSVVTIADREAETLLRAEISRTFPDDAIVGEEYGEKKGISGRRWIIDPIDGTFSFIHGIPFYGVLIGLEIDGKVPVGVINIPAMKELVSASSGNGCTYNGRSARVSSTATLAGSLLLSTDFGACRPHWFGDAAERLGNAAKMRRTWGDCYGYVMVATGRADVMLDPVMNVWDCAALMPIMLEAGGTFTDWRGQQTILGGNAIATNRVLFEEVMSMIGSQE